jgi:non-ribosomal peptide synthetase component F
MFVHQSFEAEVLRNPLATAISSNDGDISYGSLNAWANRVARALLAHGIQRDQTIGIHLDRSAAMVAAVLGVHKAGGAYVPLEVSLPCARLAFIVESASQRVAGRRHL